MVIIRLSKYGKKKKPFYHITVADNRRFRNSKFIEKIGFYNPLGDLNIKSNIFINLDRFNFWINKGAKYSKRVYYLFKKYKEIYIN